MAQTDAKAGFRLPWSSDRQPVETPDSETTEPSGGWPGDESPTATAASPTADTVETAAPQAVDPWTGEAAPVSPPPPPAPAAVAKKPSKFLADLTKAMQAAAEDARGRALTQLQSDAKTHIEAIHGRSSTEAANLRRSADDDVAAVREWSKAEIARIREETETKITARKSRLESEIEEHAAVIEREIDAVQKTVTSFEEEMAAFFERLLAEEDPSRFATMAENLPDPPAFDEIVAPAAEVEVEPVAEAVAETTETTDPVEAVAELPTDGTTSTDAPADPDAEVVAEAVAETETDVAADAAASGNTETTAVADNGDATEAGPGSAEAFEGDGEFDGELDREAAFAAIQAAAEAAASAEVAADAAARAEAVADVAIEIIGNHEEDGEADPRFAALGLSADFDAAEAEAYAAAGTSDEEIPEISDDAIAARLAGLGTGNGNGNADGATSTQVVVVGLVSVASIASFKRHLGRVPGVSSVGVSSGPEGEFVFAVSHSAEVVLRDVIPALPSFQARVTSSSDGAVHVTAHDPESDA